MEAFIIVVLLLFIYFIPAIGSRHKKNKDAILALNFFLGWTFIGWVVALVWACTAEERQSGVLVRAIPEWISCICEKCGKKIEFDSNQLRAGETARVNCPQCGLITAIAKPRNPDAPEEIKIKSSEQKPEWASFNCQHCGGNVEFDGKNLSTDETMKVKCPHCRLQTIVQKF